jgi:hypothetical protein
VNTVKVIQENQKKLTNGSKDLQTEIKKMQKSSQIEYAVLEKMHNKIESSLKARVDSIPELIS